jgi:hypothetical protein
MKNKNLFLKKEEINKNGSSILSYAHYESEKKSLRLIVLYNDHYGVTYKSLLHNFGSDNQKLFDEKLDEILKSQNWEKISEDQFLRVNYTIKN